MSIRFAHRSERVRPSAIRELLKHGSDPTITSFGGGWPDGALFPADQLRSTYDKVLREGSHEVLQYAAADGLTRLREQIADRMTDSGTPTAMEDVLIVQGAQQGIDLVGKLFINPGDSVLTESPTFLGALIAFNPYEPVYRTVGFDEDGMLVDELEAVLASDPTVKLIYTVPDFHNPAGVTLSLERRRQLVELANRYDIYILEDSPYRELRYDGQHIPTIKSLDTEARVIFAGSFSKILAPGLRVGWVVAGGAIREKLGMLKLAADTQCSTLNMAAVSSYLDTYDLDEHIAAICHAYTRKRDVMLDALSTYFPAEVTFTRPSGGLFTWVTFPEGFDTAEFMANYALTEAKVAYVPGSGFYPNEPELNHARMSFSGVSTVEMPKAIERLGTLLKKHIPSSRRLETASLQP